MRIVITGATGHIGRPLAESLARRGHKVRGVARTEKSLRAIGNGVIPWAGNMEDKSFLKRAFEGAEAVFAMIPPHPTASNLSAYQRRVTDALVSAIHANDVGRVVSLSSVGAQLPSGTGPIVGLHGLEEALDRLEGVKVTHLRPAFFMENHLTALGLIKNSGIYGSARRADLPMPMIATRDVAVFAANALMDAAFAGRAVRELLGPRDYTPAEVTRILGQTIGRHSLRYVEVPYDEARKAMLAAGMSDSVVDSYIEMERAFNEGRIRPTEARSAANTTPTTLEEFASSVFAPAFAA